MLKRLLSHLDTSVIDEDFDPMTLAEARAAVVEEWRDWPDRGETPSELDMFTFYGWLKENRPYALDFGKPGCKWATIRIWLIETEGRA